MQSWCAVIPLLAGLVTASGLVPRAGNGTIITTSGPVMGRVVNNVNEFLGIPYAQAPTGSLRFEPPQRFNGTALINATNFGFTCPQPAGSAPGAGTAGAPPPNFAAAGITPAGLALFGVALSNTAPQGEDCLSLNIWVPNGGAASKPVTIFVHGGGLTTGSSNVPMYNGNIFAGEQDVIVVNLNYRLGIFGFPSNPSVPQKNLGLLDQRMAVEWVRDNIAAFGGDNKRIVLAGQSAGSASLDLYSYAYASDPIVQGFIMQSGTQNLANGGGAALPNGPPPSSPATNTSAGWFNASAALGCGGSTSNPATVLTCMQSKNVTDIVTATTTIGFQPAADNISVFTDYPALTATGKFSKVPILIGSNDHETGLFESLSKLMATNTTASLPPSFWVGVDNSVFVCPSSARANVSVQQGVTTFRYRYFGVFPDTAFSATSGAWHSSEILQLSGVVPAANAMGVPAVTQQELAIQKYMRGAWAAFIKDPKQGLVTYGWPAYQPTLPTVVRLGINNATGPNVASAAMFDGVCNNTVAVSPTSAASGNGLSHGLTVLLVWTLSMALLITQY
ncbi:hypothetical protein N0V93_001113 [Gnomoniopsis smithogilvyi]|uniref:Carboxylic ester hydrolase n=1 Tax=Gnomoniopsis smithogilvyi TaxID=1191159 RepID=A0A9W9D2F2_9PEZI|nr:hypothetical protein N0V93_001113 [Gnomoniopsis smithogilvyi]